MQRGKTVNYALLACLWASVGCIETDLRSILDESPPPGSPEIGELVGLDDWLPSEPEANCDNTAPEEHTVRITFEEPEERCRWEEWGNLAPEDGYLTAQNRQFNRVDMSEFETVCGLTFDFDPDNTGQSIVYDDELFLVLNEMVLLASDETQVKRLQADDLFYTYDWDTLAGTPIDWSTSVPPYCVGEAEGLSSCSVPDQHVNGPVALELAPELMLSLGERALDDGNLTFGMVTIGDNDPSSDCSHSPFTFEVTIYAI